MFPRTSSATLRIVLPCEGHPCPSSPKPLKQPPSRSLAIALIVLLILRTRLLTLPKDAAVSLSGMLKGKGRGKEKQRFTKEDLAAVLQQVYLDDPKGGDGKTLWFRIVIRS